ncbi:DUF1080 domain-containing protein [Mariniphaga sediminis]|uniref:DUF1080 domain-containing protein n=1 Tax=Mariniphaga sediminis TaxID=1628158 RepID=A0A399D5U1_9BACT|nr:DUF1080 domain-containing protein [Mariniphaga sediminis]
MVEFERWNDDRNKHRAISKWDNYPDFVMFKKGKIALQDHGRVIWFRNIKI